MSTFTDRYWEGERELAERRLAYWTAERMDGAFTVKNGIAESERQIAQFMAGRMSGGPQKEFLAREHMPAWVTHLEWLRERKARGQKTY